jgi:hypothetical protein
MGVDVIRLEEEEIRTIWPEARAQVVRRSATATPATTPDSSDSGSDRDWGGQL